jgi:hypothetical protein
MHIFIVSKAAWNLPTILVHQTVADLIAAGTHESITDIIVVSDGFSALLPPGATLMSTIEAQDLVGTCEKAAIVHFGTTLKGSEKFPQYFIDLTAPKQLVDGFIANLRAQLVYNKIVKKANTVLGIKDLTAPHLPSYEWSDLALAKSSNTNGDAYFIAFVPLSDIVSTLKEFSIFKKWQQTSMAILFVVNDQKELIKAQSLVKGYKYKNAVFFKSLDQLELIDLAAAYVSVWSKLVHFYPSFMQWSAGLGVPLLINSKTTWPIAYTKAGEYFDFSESMGLSNHFKLFYKDEVYKQSKANHGHAWLNQLWADGASKNASLLDRCLP